MYSCDLYYDLPTDGMFSNFPYFFYTILTLRIMQEKSIYL